MVGKQKHKQPGAQKLILFDIDGTLLRTRNAGRDSTRAAMIEIFGTQAGIDTHVFGGKTDWLTLVELLGPHGYDAEAIGRYMPAYEKAVERHLRAIANTDNVWPCPGALETVTALRRNSLHLLGLVTGNVSTTAPVKLRAAGYDPAWFVAGAYGSEAADRSALAALALKRANAHARRAIPPQDVFVVGDTLADIACARAVGAVAVAVCTGFSSRAELSAAGPDYLLEDLTPLPELLAALSGA